MRDRVYFQQVSPTRKEYIAEEAHHKTGRPQQH